jgi:RNA polymerase sigma-70 factor (ECF subfamily)
MDSELTSRLFRAHARVILGVAFRVLRDRSQAEDVLQETFLRFLQMKDRIDETQGISGLLTKIAVNLSIDILRKRGREAPLKLDDEEEQESAPCINRPLARLGPEETLLVRQLLDRLPSIDRVVLEMRYGEQLSYQEISQALDLTVPAVAQRIRRGKEALRREFEIGKRRER